VPVAIEAPSAEAAVTSLRERRLRRGSIRERGKRLRIGLVNNMPDAAWSAMERQFAGLLDDAAEDFDIRLSLWTLETLDRPRETRRAMAGRYRTVRELRGAELLAAFAGRTASMADDPGANFPAEALAMTSASWRGTSVRLFRNWLAAVARRKAALCAPPSSAARWGG
jgi:hypothetical protein